MEVTANKRVYKFTPVELRLTLETQAELDAIGSLFNTSNIIAILEEATGKRSKWKNIYNQLNKVGADIDLWVDRFFCRK